MLYNLVEYTNYWTTKTVISIFFSNNKGDKYGNFNSWNITYRKTLLAQKLLEKYKYPYLSIDHLKMGLIRSKNTNLTVEDDHELTKYLWDILKEIIKTNIF